MTTAQTGGRYPGDRTESPLKPGLELLAYPLVFLAIALSASLLVRVLGDG